MRLVSFNEKYGQQSSLHDTTYISYCTEQFFLQKISGSFHSVILSYECKVIINSTNFSTVHCVKKAHKKKTVVCSNSTNRKNISFSDMRWWRMGKRWAKIKGGKV